MILRARHSILIGFLALFHSFCYATTPHLTQDQFYANVPVLTFCENSPERTEHNSTFVNGDNNNCNVQRSSGNTPYGEKSVLVEWGRLADCSAYTYEYPTGQCSNTPPPPTDDECLNRPHIQSDSIQTLPITNWTSPPQFVNENGCSYALTVDSSERTFSDSDCYFKSDNTTQLFCTSEYGGTGSFSDSNPDDVVTADNNPQNSQGGDSAISNTDTPETVTPDSPAVGDTTTTQTNTESTSYSDQVTLTNVTDSVSVANIDGGAVTVTTTTTTYNFSDGSSETVVETEHTRNDTNVSTTTADRANGTTSTNTEVIPGSTGNTTQTTTTATDGTQSTTTTNTGTGGSGTGQGRTDDEVDSLGNGCLETGGCESEIDGSEYLGQLDGLFDSAVGELTGDNITTNDFLPNALEMPSGTCSNPTFNHASSLATFNETIDVCTETQKIRDGLGWLFYMLTLMAVYSIATRN